MRALRPEGQACGEPVLPACGPDPAPTVFPGGIRPGTINASAVADLMTDTVDRHEGGGGARRAFRDSRDRSPPRCSRRSISSAELSLVGRSIIFHGKLRPQPAVFGAPGFWATGPIAGPLRGLYIVRLVDPSAGGGRVTGRSGAHDENGRAKFSADIRARAGVWESFFPRPRKRQDRQAAPPGQTPAFQGET